jgi:hypothetical protein
MVFEGNEIDASVLDGFTITESASSRTWVPLDAEFARAGGVFGLDIGKINICGDKTVS